MALTKVSVNMGEKKEYQEFQDIGPGDVFKFENDKIFHWAVPCATDSNFIEDCVFVDLNTGFVRDYGSFESLWREEIDSTEKENMDYAKIFVSREMSIKITE